MMPVIRTFATTAVLAVILVTVGSPAHAVPSEGGVVIQTIPKVSGFRITLDDETVVTDESGIAQFGTRDAQNLTDRVDLRDQELLLDGREVRLEPSYKYLNAAQPTVAMDVFWPVRFSFIDVNGEPIDVDRIESIQLKSQTGEIREAFAEGVTWLQGGRVVTLGGGPEYKTIPWSIQAVEYASSNVVNAAQQRFEPAETEEVVVELLFYRTKVIAKDAFFGFAIGDAVLVTSPDGRVDRFPLAEHGTVNLPSLPRGDYSIVVEGPGPQMARPVAISRNQVLDLKFYSWLDIGLVGGFLAAFAIGTLFLGWWRRRAHNSAVEDDSEWQLYGEDDEAAPTIVMPAIPASDASISSARRLSRSAATPAPPPAPPHSVAPESR